MNSKGQGRQRKSEVSQQVSDVNSKGQGRQRKSEVSQQVSDVNSKGQGRQRKSEVSQQVSDVNSKGQGRQRKSEVSQQVSDVNSKGQGRQRKSEVPRAQQVCDVNSKGQGRQRKSEVPRAQQVCDVNSKGQGRQRKSGTRKDLVWLILFNRRVVSGEVVAVAEIPQESGRRRELYLTLRPSPSGNSGYNHYQEKIYPNKHARHVCTFLQCLLVVMQYDISIQFAERGCFPCTCSLRFQTDFHTRDRKPPLGDALHLRRRDYSYSDRLFSHKPEQHRAQE